MQTKTKQKTRTNTDLFFTCERCERTIKIESMPVIDKDVLCCTRCQSIYHQDYVIENSHLGDSDV